MAVISMEMIAANKWDNLQNIPRGFLRANIFGFEPLSPEYREVLTTILNNCEDALGAMGVDNTSTVPKELRIGRHLARYYGAEAVLTSAMLGDTKDVEGNSDRLTSRDLELWQRMKDEAADKLDEFIEELELAGRTSAIWFASIREIEEPLHALKEPFYR